MTVSGDLPTSGLPAKSGVGGGHPCIVPARASIRGLVAGPQPLWQFEKRHQGHGAVAREMAGRIF